jgi:hypothetical protein
MKLLIPPGSPVPMWMEEVIEIGPRGKRTLKGYVLALLKTKKGHWAVIGF